MNPQPPPAYYQPAHQPPPKSNKVLYIVLASLAVGVIGIAVGVMGALGVFSGASTAASLVTAAAVTTHTVSPTDKFLQLAHADKLPAADDTMVPAAQDFCTAMPFETGNAAQLYLDDLVLTGGMDTAAQGRQFEYDAAQAYCPDKMNDMDGS